MTIHSILGSVLVAAAASSLAVVESAGPLDRSLQASPVPVPTCMTLLTSDDLTKAVGATFRDMGGETRQPGETECPWMLRGGSAGFKTVSLQFFELYVSAAEGTAPTKREAIAGVGRQAAFVATDPQMLLIVQRADGVARIVTNNLTKAQIIAVAKVVATVVTAATPAAAPTATGTITSGGKTLKIVDAFAFDDVGNFGDPVIRIRLSDRVLDYNAVESVMDFLFELDVQRGSAGYVDFFVERGTSAYQGATYDLGGSVNCAYCGSGAVYDGTRLRVEAGRVRGTVKVAAGSYDKGKGMGFDLVLDVPVTARAGGTPLANAAASAEAKALLACRAAVARKDAASRFSCFSPDNSAVRSVKDADPELFWIILSAYDPVFDMTNFTITAGRTRGEWVELSIEGVSNGTKAKGAVFLRRVAGVIKYSHSDIK